MSNSTHRVNVVRIDEIRGVGRAQLKLKSMAFMEKENQ